MPLEHVIDVEHQLVRSRGWGELTDADVIGHQARVAADPRFNPDFNQLVDLRDVTGTQDLSGRTIEQVSRKTVFSPTSRRAVVAASAAVFGIGRMGALYREVAGGKDVIRVFQAMEDALQWLEEANG